MSYLPKVYRKQGGDEMVVANGGKITIESGGAIENAGTTYVVTEPDDLTLEVDGGSDELQIKDGGVDLAKLASEVTDLLDILSDLPTENVASPAIWNDGGVLKVGTL